MVIQGAIVRYLGDKPSNGDFFNTFAAGIVFV